MDERLLERNRHDELRRAQRLVAAVAVATIARLANDDGSRHTRESPREQPSGNNLLAECLRELDLTLEGVAYPDRMLHKQ